LRDEKFRDDFRVGVSDGCTRVCADVGDPTRSAERPGATFRYTAGSTECARTAFGDAAVYAERARCAYCDSAISAGCSRFADGHSAYHAERTGSAERDAALSAERARAAFRDGSGEGEVRLVRLGD
jgi:hypothetical protein